MRVLIIHFTCFAETVSRHALVCSCYPQDHFLTFQDLVRKSWTENVHFRSTATHKRGACHNKYVQPHTILLSHTHTHTHTPPPPVIEYSTTGYSSQAKLGRLEEWFHSGGRVPPSNHIYPVVRWTINSQNKDTVYIPRTNHYLTPSWRGNPHNEAGALKLQSTTGRQPPKNGLKLTDREFQFLYLLFTFAATDSQPLNSLHKSCFLQQNSTVVEYSHATVHVHVRVGPVHW